MAFVRVTTLARKMGLKNVTENLDLEKRKILIPDINRTALQLTGFWDYFDPFRVQIIGMVEYNYILQMTPEQREAIYRELLAYNVPCVIFARSQEPDETLIALAEKQGVPILVSDLPTNLLEAEIIRWLHVQLAPMISIHGVLVDVYGEGVLITGESGIGKSEAALELLKRGHRLVSDDVVEIRRVSDDTLVGTSPELTRHFIELRGIGIIDVKTLFGIESVKNTQNIDLVIKLTDWNKSSQFDRMGMEDQYIEYLGKQIVCHHIPVRPGRNLAIIVEAAAVNHRQKKMGYNAAVEFYNRVQENLKHPRDEEEDGNEFFY